MERSLEQLNITAYTRNPLSTMLRQLMILQAMEGLRLTHGQELYEALQQTTSKALLIKSSAALPPSLRRAGDLDITVHMDDSHYRPAMEKGALAIILEPIAKAMQADLHFITKDGFAGKRTLERLHDRQGLLLPYFVKHFRVDDMQDIKATLESFDIPAAELKALDAFGPEMIANIVDARKAEAKRHGTEYIPTAEEQTGTGLSEVVSADIITNGRYNCYAPIGFGMKQLFIGEERDADATLAFQHPYEDAADKILMMVTHQLRTRYEEPRAKDLLDLYIRTGDCPTAPIGFLPYKITDRANLIDLVRAYLPSRSEFYEKRLSGALHFTKLDPRIRKNVKQVRDGLLALQAQGVIGEAVFSEPVTEQNAEQCAQKILKNAWEIFEQSLGVKAEGSASNPTYKIEPPEKVLEYWRACKLMRKDLNNSRRHRHDREAQMSMAVETLGTKIGAMLEGDYPQGPDRIKKAGAINAYKCALYDRLSPGTAIASF